MRRLKFSTWIKIIACLGALWLLSTIALPHEHAGMVYDKDCCHNQDCAPVIDAVMGWASEDKSLPVMWVRTIHGIAPVTAQTRILESKDARSHACIRYGAVVCYYQQPGG